MNRPLSAIDVFLDLVRNAPKHGIDPEPFRRRARELQRARMRRILTQVARIKRGQP